MTATDLRELEKMLLKIGEEDGETLLKGMLAQSKAPSLVHFVRGLVGMDRAAAQEAFSKLLRVWQTAPDQDRGVYGEYLRQMIAIPGESCRHLISKRLMASLVGSVLSGIVKKPDWSITWT